EKAKGHPRRREWPLEIALLKADSTNSPTPAGNSGRANRDNRRKGNTRRSNTGDSHSRNSRSRVRHRPRRRDRNSPSRAANRRTLRPGRLLRALAETQTSQPTTLPASSCEVLLRGAASALPEKRKRQHNRSPRSQL